MSSTNIYKIQLESLIKVIPGNLSCGDFHHSKKDRHCAAEKCPPLERFIQELTSSIKLTKGEQ